MQIHFALFATTILARVVSGLPTQQTTELAPLAEAALGNELIKKHEDAGWLLAVLPEGETEQGAAEEKTLVKKDEDESGIAPKVFIVSMV